LPESAGIAHQIAIAYSHQDSITNSLQESITNSLKDPIANGLAKSLADNIGKSISNSFNFAFSHSYAYSQENAITHPIGIIPMFAGSLHRRLPVACQRRSHFVLGLHGKGSRWRHPRFQSINNRRSIHLQLFPMPL
jgi:hypothetical protein